MVARPCRQPCPHLTAEKTDRCSLPFGHDGQHVAVEADGRPKYTWQIGTSR